MNKTFKVARSLTRGTVVTSEKASSYQGKAVKTVIAAAVALVAGSAMAATPADGDLTIQNDGTLTITNGKAQTTTPAAGTILVLTDAATGKTENAQTAQLVADKNYTLKDGNLVLIANKDATADSTWSVNTLEGNGVVTLTAYNQTSDQDVAHSTTLTVKEGGLAAKANESITVNFGSTAAVAEKDKGTATLKFGADAKLGYVDADSSAKDSVATFVVGKDTNAVIESANITLKNAVFHNEGELTFSGNVAVDQNLDTTAEAGKFKVVGDLTVAPTTADAVSYTAKNVYVGADTAPTTPDALKAAYNNAETLVTGNVKVGTETGANEDTALATFKADTLTINTDQQVNVYQKGVLDAATLNVHSGSLVTTAGTGNVAGGVLKTTDMTVFGGTVTLGGESTITNMTVASGATDVTSTGTTTITDLTIGTSTKNDEDAATMTVNDGKFVVTNAVVGTAYNSKDSLTVNNANGTLNIENLTVSKTATFDLQAAKKATLGTVDAQGAVNIGGTTSVASLKVADSNTKVAVTTGAKVSLADVTIGKSASVTATGADLTLGTLTVGGSTTETNLGKLTVKGGKLTTDISNVLASEVSATEIKTQDKLVLDVDNTDKVDLSLTGAVTYTAKNYAAVAAKLANAENIRFLEGTLTGENSALAAFSDVAKVGNYAAKSTVELKETTTEATASGTVTVGAIKVTSEATEDTKKVAKITVQGTDSTHPLVLRGDQDNQAILTLGDGVKADAAVTFKDVQLGEKATDGGAYAGLINVESTLKVAAGNFTLGNITGTGSVSTDKGNLTLLGDTTLEVTGSNNTKYTPLTIGYTKGAGASAKVEATYKGTITVAEGTFLALGDYEAQAAAKLSELQADYEAELADPTTAGKVGLIYVGQQTKLAVAPSFATGSTNENNLYIDLGNVAATAGYDKTQGILAVEGGTNKVTADYAILDNLSSKVVSTVEKEHENIDVINVGDVTAGEFEFTNVFYQADAQYHSEGLVQVQIDDGMFDYTENLDLNTWGDVKNAIYSYDGSSNPIANTVYRKLGDWLDAADDDLNQKLVAAGFFKEGTTVEQLRNADRDGVIALLKEGVELKDVSKFEEAYYEAFENALVNAEHAATNMAALGGAFSASLDAQNEVVGAINRRLSKANVNAVRGEVGVTPWVDVFGTTNEAKRLYGSNAGYEADIYGAVLGFDYTASCGGTLGVAFNIGTGDGNSVGAGQKVENDQDFYGVSLYAAKEFGGFNTMLDLGYMTVENDLSTSSAFFGKTSEKLDADLFTVGLGAEYALDAGVAKVTPHAGIRMTRLSMDDSKYGADYDDMTVYQLPLGVAVSSTFETNGWKLAPMADISVVPTFGDKDAVATFTGGITDTVRVVDTNPVQGTLGVEAQNGAFTFGLNYRLTAGGDDRMNNSFNANVRYAF